MEQNTTQPTNDNEPKNVNEPKNDNDGNENLKDNQVDVQIQPATHDNIVNIHICSINITTGCLIL